LEELSECDLTLVVWVSCTLYGTDELKPSLSYYFKEFCEYLDGMVLMHLLMENTEVLVVLGGLPTFLVVTTVYLACSGFVLSEVQTFCWKHF